MNADKFEFSQMTQQLRASSGVELLLRLSSFVGPLEPIDAIGLALIHETLRELDDHRRSHRTSTQLTVDVGMECERRALVKLGYTNDQSTTLFLQSYWRWQRGPLREAIWNRTDQPETTRMGCLRAMVRGVYGIHGFADEPSLASLSTWLRRVFGVVITPTDLLAHVQGELCANPRTSFLLLNEEGRAVPDQRAIRDSLGARTHRRRRVRERDLDPSAIAPESDANDTPEFSEQAHEFRQGRALLDRLRNHAMERRDRALEAALDRLTGEDPTSRSLRGVATKFGITVASVRAGHERMIRLAKHFRSFG